MKQFITLIIAILLSSSTFSQITFNEYEIDEYQNVTLIDSWQEDGNIYFKEEDMAIICTKIINGKLKQDVWEYTFKSSTDDFINYNFYIKGVLVRHISFSKNEKAVSVINCIKGESILLYGEGVQY